MSYSTSSLIAWPYEASDGVSNAASVHVPHSATYTVPAAPAHGTYASRTYGANNGNPSPASVHCDKHRSSYATSAWPGITQTTAP